jgi:hypothetical protein
MVWHVNHRTIVSIAALLAASDCSTLRCGHAVVPARVSLSPIALPDWSSGTGFDDLVFARGIRRLLVPAGRSGKVFLVDPDTKAVASIKGFSTGQGIPGGAHEVGPTSSDEGPDALFVIDRTADRLSLVDLDSKRVVAVADLPSTPDYVRYVYVPESDSATLSVMAVSETGSLSLVATAATVAGAHCVVADDRGCAWVCDREHGQLLLYTDFAKP